MSNNVSPWAAFSGPNLGYVMDMYDLYITSPEEVDAELVALFEQYGAPVVDAATTTTSVNAAPVASGNITKILAAVQLADAIRAFGHLAADIYPLHNQAVDTKRIEAATYGLSDQDLKEVSPSLLLKDVPASVKNGLDAINYLKAIFTDKIAYEFSQVVGQEENAWIQSKIESGSLNGSLSADEKKEVLNLLNKVEGFEQFMHKTFVGVKRFSIEGVDALVVLIDEIIRRSETKGTKDIQIGMAHRGRLNVLTHNVNKSYKMMLADFAHVPGDAFVPKDGSLIVTKGWSGDAKYHLGAKYNSPTGSTISLAYNPSHLEVVSPVVNGATRAVQDDTSKPGLAVQDTTKSVSILVHGDAAFAGQGVVTEGFNYAGTKGFTTGGSVHIIANNMIGFTTERFDSRTTTYSSDSAKGYEIPIIHVNADAPEAVVQVARFAVEYRAKFGKDIIIDLIGYRRYGHNEMDEPMITNPEMYNIVHKHETVRALYGKQLVSEGVVTDADVQQLQADIKNTLQTELDEVRATKQSNEVDHTAPKVVLDGFPEVETGVTAERLTKMNEELLAFPAEFNVFKKLSKILARRQDPFVGKGKIDWGHAETLAFGTIIQDGHPVRISGQDAQRGTFAHRHLVLHDEKNGDELTMLHNISDSHASFTVVNSPLSEGSILAYEFGYNVENPNALSIWEAQYGDFANMAQVIFDNFISAARAKWGVKSGLVMLLPHAAEGQGSEHSSAHLERFLQSSAENNWTVANVSSAANYFHLLRRQAAMLGTDAIRPLVLVSPKSLLRNQIVAATVEELSTGKFETIIEHPTTGSNAKKVEKLVFASGKMAIDIAEKVGDGTDFDHLHLVRVEQLYPFPSEKIAAIIEKFPNVKNLAWAQEEPKNMGSWSFADPYLRDLAGKKAVSYVGRPEHASPAEGDPDSFKVAQTIVIEDAVSK
ncbi:2-oxoglutarate dehydrogenase E1 component [Kurthia sibirica]|uniref:oxoglutarate dehydrogenase (succinyl-transferring) n=1 Tax=Kurthia sibirica TaxID=202750 RepID=A0A2U3AP92_9BACL|nr:2-oxoglutarate dehydrogenase E1 component [Kurthia sibirica]PWI26362.1 2-oxoglutarate dehydrogenase E1 component [Kurthia sibirica]GEK34864.1 2-oxoglutarate dehydrogenase E1 component [Kurthia sibirica]